MLEQLLCLSTLIVAGGYFFNAVTAIFFAYWWKDRPYIWLVLALGCIGGGFFCGLEGFIRDPRMVGQIGITLNQIQQPVAIFYVMSVFLISEFLLEKKVPGRRILLGSLYVLIALTTLDVVFHTDIFTLYKPNPLQLDGYVAIYAQTNPNFYWIYIILVMTTIIYGLGCLALAIKRLNFGRRIVGTSIFIIFFFIVAVGSDFVVTVQPDALPTLWRVFFNSSVATAGFLVFLTSILVYQNGEDLRRRTLAAEEARSYAQSLFSTSPTPLLVLDPQGNVLEMNPPASALLLRGATPVGHPFADLLAPEVMAQWKVFWKSSQNSQTLDLVTAQREQGEYTFVRSSAGPGGNVIFAVIDLAASRLERDKWLADKIIHDIRNQLSGLSSCMAELEDGPNSHQQIAATLRLAYQGIQVALNRFSTVLGRNRDTELRLFNLEDALTDAIWYLNRVWPEVQFERKRPTEDRWVEGQAGEITSLFINLLKNAAEVMQGRGTIRVTESIHTETHTISELANCAPGKYILLRLEDEGSGIPPEDLDRIFLPGYTTKVDGAGLGLSSAQEIARQHGGKLWAEPGKTRGARFVVALPLTLKPHENGKMKISAGDIGTLGTGRSVLVVDDVQISAAAMGTFLRRAQFSTSVCHNPNDALRKLQDLSLPFELLVTDYRLPYMNGGELIRRGLELRPDLRVIICTAVADQEELEALQKDFNLYIIYKPIEMLEFLSVVKLALESPKALD